MKMQNRLKKHSLKFVSVFMSLFLWVYVLNSEKIKFEKTVVLDYVLPVDMLFAEKPQHEATFLIEGPRAFVRTLTEREDRIVIDLNEANAKRQLNFSISINPAKLDLPFGMVVEKVLPKKVAIRLEKKASKIVPLKLQFSGELPKNLSLHHTTVNPAEVEVYGPRSVIANLSYLPLKPIELENLEGQEVIPVEIQLPDERLSVRGGFDLKFTYELKGEDSNFVLKNIPIRFPSDKFKVTSLTKVASLKLLVPEKIIKNRSNVSSTVQVWAEIPDKARGRVEVPLKAILPPSIHLMGITPKTIIVNIK